MRGSVQLAGSSPESGNGSACVPVPTSGVHRTEGPRCHREAESGLANGAGRA
jgi:hypothetical protein